MFEKLVSEFANWMASTNWSVGLHESLYMWGWFESVHVLFLMISLGMLIVIDLRMLGWWMGDVSASKIASRLEWPMLIGFSVMVISGLVLFTSVPVRYSHSVWFRFKLILLFAAAINAFLFRRYMQNSVGTWDTDKIPPSRARFAAALSLCLWFAIVVCGRLIAYEWFDCGNTNKAFIVWASGCSFESNAQMQ